MLPVKKTPDQRWRTFVFHVVYEYAHPGRDSDGLFGGTIKMYPMTKLKPGFHDKLHECAADIGCIRYGGS